MTTIDCLKNVFLNELFNISGRCSRKEFWVSYFLYIPIGFLVVFFFSFVGYIISDNFGNIIGDITSNILLIWSYVALFTSSIRRSHDIGKSGWFMLIPIYNSFLLLRSSQQNENDWGSPKPHSIRGEV